MRQHIDTIPVWDAFKLDCECPLCELKSTNEDNYVHSFTGGSVMEPDVRVEVNMKGFCARHFKLMMVGDRRLGVALMAHTYLKQTMARLGEASQAVQSVPAKGGFFSRKAPSAGVNLKPLTDSCILCDRLNATMERYVYTTVHLWKKDGSFRAQFKGSKGFCLVHYAELLNAAPEQLSGQELKQFTDMLNEVEMTNLKRVAEEIEWFTLKFDHKNADKPWGNSRDALPRTVLKLRGKE
ncbi:MAG: hypothetical protein II875_04980 [Clostridia bacterium]|nr:hypothetical protein [Clostridia bacterium]